MKKAFRVVGLITTFSFVGAYAISSKRDHSKNDQVKEYQSFEKLEDVARAVFREEVVQVDQLNLSAAKKLKLVFNNGTIKIQNTEGSELRIAKTVPKSAADNKNNLAKLLSKTGADQTTITLGEESKLDSKQIIEVFVPKTFRDIRIETTSADLDVKDLAVDLMTVASKSGDLRLRRTQFESFEFDTLSGDVSAIEVHGNHLKLNSVSGDVILANFTLERLNLNSTSGDLLIKPNAGAQFVIDAKSVTGDISNQSKYQGDSKQKISANTVSGDIRFE